MIEDVMHTGDILNDMLDATSEMSHVVTYVLGDEKLSNPLVLFPTSMAIGKMLESAKKFTEACRTSTDILRTVAKQAEIDIPKYDPDAPREWMAVFKP